MSTSNTIAIYFLAIPLFLPTFVVKSPIMYELTKLLLLISATVIFFLFAWAAIVSWFEKEFRASKKLLGLAFLLPAPFLATSVFSLTYQDEIGIALLIISAIILILLLIPIGRKKLYQHAIPASRIDERDTMFSRNELEPGTKEFEEYYHLNPGKKGPDDIFRSKAGLLKPGSSQYNAIHFASADASFETISALKNKVDGDVANTKVEIAAPQISSYIKSWAHKLGAKDCGITLLKPYHLYSIGGRAERRNIPVLNGHAFAIAFTVEMSKEMVNSAPSGSIVMESAQQYLESGIIAIQVAAFIRNLGYEARAHIDGNYQVVCPLVARDAGLGEIGRMGLLMTPKLGPRVRISVVTTNLPLVTDLAVCDSSIIDFCEKCKKCADSCPGQAISSEPRKEIDGALRWQINQESCFTLWCKLGTDCGRCISVCPYSHSDNAMHNLVRKGLKNSSVFRSAALKMDDFLYGRKPAIAGTPEWLRTGKEKK